MYRWKWRLYTPDGMYEESGTVGNVDDAVAKRVVDEITLAYRWRKRWRKTKYGYIKYQDDGRSLKGSRIELTEVENES